MDIYKPADRIKTREEQIEEAVSKIKEQYWILNTDYVIEQFRKNPEVEFEIYNVYDFIKEYVDPDISRRTRENVSYGNYGWLRVKGTPKPEFIIN